MTNISPAPKATGDKIDKKTKTRYKRLFILLNLTNSNATKQVRLKMLRFVVLIIPKFAIEVILRRKLFARKSAANFLGYPAQLSCAGKHNENPDGIFIGRPFGRILLLQNPGLL